MNSEFSRWFTDAIGLDTDSRTDAGQRTSPKKMEEESEAKGYIENGIVYDAQGNMIDELPLEDPDFPFDPVDLLGYIGYGASLGRLYRAGSEIVFKPKSGQIRIAPFGNRGGHPDYGRWPHYHVEEKTAPALSVAIKASSVIGPGSPGKRINTGGTDFNATRIPFVYFRRPWLRPGCLLKFGGSASLLRSLRCPRWRVFRL